MSAAAEELAKACNVKGSRRALLDTIATLIPEGQTMTPPIALEDLAARAGYYEMTMRQARDRLVGAGMLRVVGGGRGRPASYELLALPGAGDAPSLPLIGATPRRSRSTAGPDLFDPPHGDQFSDAVRVDDIGTKYRTPTENVGKKYRTLVDELGTFYRTLLAIVSKFGTFYRTVLKKVGTKYRTPTPVVDVGSRARARSAEEIQEEEAARAREVEAFLDWFEAEYPVHHDGARCSLERAPDGLRIRVLLQRGRTIDRLKAMTAVLWTLTTDGVKGSDRWFIAERVSVRNIWLLHRKADFLDAEVSRRASPPAAAARAVTGSRTRRTELLIGGSTCPHTPRCERTSDCIQRVIDEGRAERDRKSG